MILYPLPPTSKRVLRTTPRCLNEEIRKQTLKDLRPYVHNEKKLITRKIRKLNEEWDTERVLEAHSALCILLSTLLARKHSKKWYCFTGSVGFFLLLHALKGWCPPLPFYRYLKVRTPEEIYKEKMALKFYRGDFPPASCHPDDVLSAFEKE